MSEEKIIPNNWRIKKLGEICKPKEGLRRGPFGSAIKKEFFVAEGYKVYEQSNAIYDDVSRGKYFIDEKKYQELINFNVVPDDLIVSCSGTLGKIAQIPINAKSGVINQALLRIRLIDEIISRKYFLYFFRSEQFQRKIFDQSQGTAMSNLIGIKDFKEIEIPIPPLEVQHAIVSKIEELLSDLENGKQQLILAHQQLKIYRQSLLKWAFEGKLTENWRKENKVKKTAFETLQEVSAKRKKIYSEKKKLKEKRIELNYDFIFSKSEFIDSWALASLDKLIYIAGRIGWRGLTKDEYTKEGPLFLSVHSLNYGKYVDFKDAYHISEERFLESPEIILQNNDILLCKDGAGIGKIGIIKTLPQKGTVNSSLLIIRGLEIFTPEYLFYLLSGPKLQHIVQSRISGSATPHLFQNDIRKFELLVPPIEEQQLIVDELESKLTICDKIGETISQSLLQAESLRQSILKKAFEGKLIDNNYNIMPS